MNKPILLSLAVCAALPVWAIQGTIQTETDTKSGDIKWQPRSKSYALSYRKGKTDVSAEYPLSDVVAIEVAKPAGYDKAVEQVERGQGASAIPVLLKIVQDYKMIQWDKPAGRYLALAYIAAGQAQKAYEMCEVLIKEDKDSAWKGELAYAYWQSLLKLGKNDKLESLLKKAASSADRPTSAAALVMRGDIICATGDSPDILKQALRDGYLRVVLMYTDVACNRERAVAMDRAAKCFDKLGQSSRAERLRAQAKTL